MKAPQGAVFETLPHLQRFLDDNSATFDTVNQSDARKRLDDTVTRLGSHAVAQVGSHRTSQGETARQRMLGLDLRNNHMRPIAVIASQKLREAPEFTKLVLPPLKVLAPVLTVAARDMANAAEQYTELFVKEGLAPDFVAQLRAAADALDQSLIKRGQNVGQRAFATKGLEMETKEARALIRQLDSLVRPKLTANPELLREWEVASHIKRPRTVASATPTGTTSTPAATTATAASPATAASTATAASPTTPVAAPVTSTPAAAA